jgi:hypothetical protein
MATPPQEPVKPQAPIDERLVRYAWVAARLSGVATSKGGFEEWSERCFGRRLTDDHVRAYVTPLTPPTRKGRPRKHAGEAPKREGPTPALREWLAVDEQRLELLSVMFELPNRDFVPRSELFERLEKLPGIKQVIEIKEDGDIVALGLVRNMSEADDLKALVQEEVAGQGVRMRLIARESHAAAPATWLELTKRQAARGAEG